MYKIINSDVYSGIYSLIDNSIDVVITSPPYWGQRDYGFDEQIGNEPDYNDYINKLVCIFNLLLYKIKDSGVFFLNIGDKYISKYGKSPLAMIPYKLAHSMQKNGWLLNDTIIWYKPNHMPSSVKNRFTNSYEPVFVFSKSQDNFYLDKCKRTENYNNIIKIPLQPTPFKHIAVYPEKLVLELLKKLDLPANSWILDPFAGSGTTLKVVKEFFPNATAIMIEKNEKYIDIIKERCNLNGEIKINKLDFIPYYTEQKRIEANITIPIKLNGESNISDKNDGFSKIFDDRVDYYRELQLFFNQTYKISCNPSATFFLGCKDFDNDLIYQTALLNTHGWIIRNMIVIEENNRWYPVFMIVEDNKKAEYNFNYKSLELKSKDENNRNWYETNFINYKVIDTIHKRKNKGVVVDILERYNNGFPKYLVVEWENQRFTKEYVVFSEESLNRNLIINKDGSSINISEIINFVQINNEINYQKNSKIEQSNTLFELPSVHNYNGKYKEEKRINYGASPGARTSMDQEYFSLQRLYKVEQKLVADYLNKKRKEKNISKTELTNYFPKEYKHTVGHWLRSDFGGSIPAPEDWAKLINILNIEENMTNYVCKTALRLQTVKHSEYKIPADFQDSEFINKFEVLISCKE